MSTDLLSEKVVKKSKKKAYNFLIYLSVFKIKDAKENAK